MGDRTAVHVSKTGKDLERNTQEVNQRLTALIQEINCHEVEFDTAVEVTIEELGETKGDWTRVQKAHQKKLGH